MPENNKLVINHFNTIGKRGQKTAVLSPVKTKQLSPERNKEYLKPKDAVEELANELVSKV